MPIQVSRLIVWCVSLREGHSIGITNPIFRNHISGASLTTIEHLARHKMTTKACHNQFKLSCSNYHVGVFACCEFRCWDTFTFQQLRTNRRQRIANQSNFIEVARSAAFGTSQIATGIVTDERLATAKQLIFLMEKEGARWCRWSSKPVWGS